VENKREKQVLPGSKGVGVGVEGWRIRGRGDPNNIYTYE
jgi:hypothetical protein